MVRATANRAFEPAKAFFTEIGEMMILTGRTMLSAVKAPYPYGNEFIGQFLFALQLCWFPMLVSTVAFGFGAPGLQAAMQKVFELYLASSAILKSVYGAFAAFPVFLVWLHLSWAVVLLGGLIAATTSRPARR